MVHKKKASQGLQENFGALRLLGFQHAHQVFQLAGRTAGALDFGARLLHRLGDTLLVKRFEKVVNRVYFEGFDGILIEGRREDDFRKRDLLIEQFLNHTKAIQAGHLDIEENQIGIVLADKVYGFDAVLALRDDVNVSDALEQIREFVAG